MLKLHVLQAEFGDCLLLEYGTASESHFTLIDGGPPTTYDRHLRSVLETVKAAGAGLDRVVLSHVDNDHVTGLLDYFAELRTPDAEAALPKVGGLWHNSFARAIDPEGGVEARLRTLITNTRAAVMTNAGMAVNGIAEGNSLRLAAQVLQIPLNADFPDDLILVDTAPSPIESNDLTIRIVGPDRSGLDELRAEWQSWLDTHEDAVGSGDPFVMANSDRSVPNLSSIMFLAEGGGKTVLLTGDGRGDHLLHGLEHAGLLDDEGRMHVDVLKLAHHGSDRNATRTFFKKLTADTYVASANGRDGNPDLATLIWIVEAARDQDRRVKLLVTNRTSSVTKLLEEYDPAEYGYELEVMPADRDEMILELA